MNFLSHFYFVQPNPNPYYTLGSILPDLFRNHRNDWKFSPEKQNLDFNNNADLNALLEGWKLHVQVDALFHNSVPFKLQTSLLRLDLKQVFTKLPKRPFFLAHIGYELILDSLLIRNNLIDTNQFYKNLNDCDPIIIDEFMNKLGITEGKNFHAFLRNFIESRYLESYSSIKSIVYALDRIGQRVWIEGFSESEFNDTSLVLDRFSENLNPTFLDVFNLLEQEITL